MSSPNLTTTQATAGDRNSDAAGQVCKRVALSNLFYIIFEYSEGFWQMSVH